MLTEIFDMWQLQIYLFIDRSAHTLSNLSITSSIFWGRNSTVTYFTNHVGIP